MNVMTCREMETLLRDMVPQSQSTESKTMDPQAMSSQAMPSDAAAHLAGCPRCSAQLEQERRLTANLAALAESTVKGAAPAAMPSMEARLRAAFREHWRARRPEHMHERRPVHQLAVRKSSLWAAGAAATIILSLSVLLFERQPSQAPVEPPARAAASPANSPAADPGAIRAEPGPGAAPPNPSTSGGPVSIASRAASAPLTGDARPVAAPVKISSPEAEQAVLRRAPQVSSEFVPLYYGGDPQLLGAGQVWRVEMPRGALQPVGMPVVEESRAGRVQVDILLGEDGIARAIRLVP